MEDKLKDIEKRLELLELQVKEDHETSDLLYKAHMTLTSYVKDVRNLVDAIKNQAKLLDDKVRALEQLHTPKKEETEDDEKMSMFR